MFACKDTHYFQNKLPCRLTFFRRCAKTIAQRTQFPRVKKQSRLVNIFFAFSCAVSRKALTLHPKFLQQHYI